MPLSPPPFIVLISLEKWEFGTANFFKYSGAFQECSPARFAGRDHLVPLGRESERRRLVFSVRGTTVSGDRRHFLVGQGETRTETPFLYDGGLGCLGHGGQDCSGEAQSLALFGPVERQVLPLSQPARGELRRLLAVQDGGDDIGREEREAEKTRDVGADDVFLLGNLFQ